MGGGTTSGERIDLKYHQSHIDAMRQFVYSGGLPKERAGYILARQALFFLEQRDNERNGPEFVHLAFHQLTDDVTADQHEPPLSPELRDMTIRYMQEYPYDTEWHRGRAYGWSAALLLNMVIDHGSKPQ